MKRPEVRPKIKLVVPLSANEVLERLRRGFEAERSKLRGSVLGSCVELTVRCDQQHFWSPQISLQVEQHDEGAILHGRVGPRPQVWTGLMAAYAIIGFSSFFAFFFGMSHWLLDRPLWPLWAVPLGIAFAGVVYLIAYVGQRLGADQTQELADVLDAALELPPDSLRG